MKTQDLIDLGLSQEVAEKIFVLHGKDIEKLKESAQTATTEMESIKNQLTEANKQIESFKGMKTQEEVDAAVSEYKTKFEQAQAEHEKELSSLKFDHALESALTGAKAKNIKAVQALLTKDTLKLKDDGTIEGLEDQLKAIKTENDYLFAGSKEPPKIVAGGKSQPVLGDKVVDAARKAAGLTVAETPTK